MELAALDVALKAAGLPALRLPTPDEIEAREATESKEIP
jgi:hypothetical protein